MDQINKITIQLETGQDLPRLQKEISKPDDSKMEVPIQGQLNLEQELIEQVKNESESLIDIQEDIEKVPILGKRKYSSRKVTRNKKYDADTDQEKGQISSSKKNKQNNLTNEIILNNEDADVFEEEEEKSEVIADEDEEIEEEGQIEIIGGRRANRKQNFTRNQTSILKKWFIQHADNPYLKEESRNELAKKTGLEQRQVSNWFTNVRKRIWQPIKKKSKNNKGKKDLMLKVKLKLDTDNNSCSSSSEIQGSSGQQIEEDPPQFTTNDAIVQRQIDSSSHQYNAFQLLENGLSQNRADIKNLRFLPHPINQQNISQEHDNFYMIPAKKSQQMTGNSLNITKSFAQISNHKTEDNVSAHQNGHIDSVGADINVPMEQTPAHKMLNVQLQLLQHQIMSQRFSNNIDIGQEKEIVAKPSDPLPDTLQQTHLNQQQNQDNARQTYESPASGDEYAQQKFQLSQSHKNGAVTGEQYISDNNNEIPKRQDILESIRNYRQNIMTQENKRILKENSKDEELDGNDVISDSIVNERNRRLALKQFMKQSRVLRFKEKMQNVKLWRNDSIAFAAENGCMIEQPAECNGPIDEIDFKLIDQIEKQFSDHERKMNETAQDKDKDQQQYKRRKLNEDIIKVSFGKGETNGQADHDDSMHHGANSMEVPVSLPHSKSLSNNRSRSSKNEMPNDSNANMTNFPQNFPYQFIPIILICCPSVVKGQSCSCGFNSYYPANDFYSSQLSKFLNNQQAIFGQNKSNTNQSQDQGNSGRSGEGGSGASGFAESGAGGVGRNVSGSNPSNPLTSGESWQTSAGQNPLNFIALLNSLNTQAQKNIQKGLNTNQPIAQNGNQISPNTIMSSINKSMNVNQQKDDPSQTPNQQNQQNPNFNQNLQDMILQHLKKFQQDATQKEQDLKNQSDPQQVNAPVNNMNGANLQQSQNLSPNQVMSMPSANGVRPLQNNQPVQSLNQNQNQMPSSKINFTFGQNSVANKVDGNGVAQTKQEGDEFDNHINQSNQMINQVKALNEITNSFNHLIQMDELKKYISSKNGCTPQSELDGLGNIASVFAGAAEKFDKSQSQTGDQQSLQIAVQGLIQLLQQNTQSSNTGKLGLIPHQLHDQLKQQISQFDLIGLIMQQQANMPRENVNSASDPSGSGGSARGNGKSGGSGKSGSGTLQSQSKSGLGSGTTNNIEGILKNAQGNEYSVCQNSVNQDLQSRQSRVGTAPTTNQIMNSTSTGIDNRQNCRSKIQERREQPQNDSPMGQKNQTGNEQILEQLMLHQSMDKSPEVINQLLNLLAQKSMANIPNSPDKRVSQKQNDASNLPQISQVITQKPQNSSQQKPMGPFPQSISQSNVMNLLQRKPSIQYSNHNNGSVSPNTNQLDIKSALDTFNTFQQMKKATAPPQQGILRNLQKITKYSKTEVKSPKSIPTPNGAVNKISPMFQDKKQIFLNMLHQQKINQQSAVRQNGSPSPTHESLPQSCLKNKSKDILSSQNQSLQQRNDIRDMNQISNNVSNTVCVNTLGSTVGNNINNVMPINKPLQLNKQVSINNQVENEKSATNQLSTTSLNEAQIQARQQNPQKPVITSTSNPTIEMQLFNKMSDQLIKAIETQRASGNSEEQQKLIEIVQILIASASKVQLSKDIISNKPQFRKPDEPVDAKIQFTHQNKTKTEVELPQEELTLDPRVDQKQIHKPEQDS